MDAELFGFGAEEETALANKVDVPGAGGVDASSESGGALNVADAKGTI